MTSTRQVQPFPFEALPRVSRQQAQAIRAVAQFLEPLTRPALLADVLGSPLIVRVLGVDRVDSGAALRTLPTPVACWLGTGAPRGGVSMTGWALELDTAFAQRLCGRALGAAHGGSVASLRPLTPAEEGVLAYLLLRALADLGQSGRCRLLGVSGDVRRIQGHLGDGALVGCELAVSIEGDRARARLLVPEATALAQPTRVAREASLAPWIRSLPVEACLELGAARLTRAELQAIVPGDIVVMDWLDRARLEPGARVRIVVGRRARPLVGVVAALSGVEIVGPDNEVSVEHDEPSLGGALVEDVEIALVAVAGRAQLTVAELSQLSVGQVLTLGRPLDGAVELCVNGRRVARGVLVDVEGEVGVRLVELG